MILVPITVLMTAAYFILVTAERAQDSKIKAFGKYLSLWMVVLSVLLVVGTAIGPDIGGRGPRFAPAPPRDAFPGFLDFPGPARPPFPLERRDRLEQAPGENSDADKAVPPRDQEPKTVPAPAP